MAKILRQTANRINSLLVNGNILYGFTTNNPQKPTLSQLLQKINPFPHQQAITDPQFITKCPTFPKQVLSCVLLPQLISGPTVSYQASKRASSYLNQVKSVGTYSTPLGTPLVRKNVAKYIAQSTGIEQPSIDNVVLMPGVTHAIRLIMKCLIVSQSHSIMVPFPSNPNYKNIVEIAGGHCSPYYLKEKDGWGIDLNQLERSYQESSKNGKHIKALIIVNPGHPSGTLYDQPTLQQLIQFAHKHKLFIIADQSNSDYIYNPNKPFTPLLKLLNQMDPKYLTQCQVMSLYSIQNTPLAKIGVKAGYIHCHNVNPEILEQFFKLWNMCYSSNICGQIALDLVRMPFLGEVGQRIREEYQREMDQLFQYMRRRVNMVERHFQGMHYVKMGKIQAGHYGYAQIKLPKTIIKKAQSVGLSLDEYFCQQVKANLNLYLTPATYYGQQPTNPHFGINILNGTSEQLNAKLRQLKQFIKKFGQQVHT